MLPLDEWVQQQLVLSLHGLVSSIAALTGPNVSVTQQSVLPLEVSCSSISILKTYSNL